MKRDMELVRELLLRLEDMPMRAGGIYGIEWGSEFFEFSNHDREKAIKHFKLLVEAGYVSAPSGQGMTCFMTSGLTWEGHEFIDSVRSPEIWTKTKAGMKSVGGVGLDVMVQLAKAEGKRLLAEKMGIVF